MSYNAEDIRCKLKEVQKAIALGEATEDMMYDVIHEYDELIDFYDTQVEGMENDISNLDAEVSELHDKLNDIECTGSAEKFAESILRQCTGHDPSLGDVLSLKDDLVKLLTEKYQVSLGNT